MKNKIFKWSINATWIIFLLSFLSITLVIVAVYKDSFGLFGGLPSLEKLERPDPELSSQLLSADGESLGSYYRHNRTQISYSQLSQPLVDALLVTEDVRFVKHSGIDLRAILRAASGLFTGFKGGGSTITMQLAQNLYRTESKNIGSLYGKHRVVSGIITKFKEFIISVILESNYTKEEIIAMYLNTIEYGSNSYGIKVASNTFFDKEPSQLEYKEAAVLVGLINAPTRYNPVYNPENALRKRTEVLWNLYKYKKINREQYDSLNASDFGLNYKVENHNKGIATYFRTRVQQNFLLSWCRDNGYDLYADGLRIFTTIDSRMQKHAEKAVEEHMKVLQTIFDDTWEGEMPWRDKEGRELENYLENTIKRTEQYKSLARKFDDMTDSIDYYLNLKKRMRIFSWDGDIDTVFSSYDSLKYYKKFLHSGFMAMDPHTGAIKAWVGGINKKYFQVDHVKQSKRQPGSTFKPIVYATAIERGYNPCFELADVKVTFDLPGQDPSEWSPSNSNNKFTNELMTLRRAMAKSINSVTAQVMQKIGAEEVVDYAHRMGITSKIAAVPTLCLGAGGEVSLFEMVGAYSTFVNKGFWTQPTFITKIEDRNGNILQEFIPKRVEAINVNTSYAMLHMLRGATEEPGGTAQGMDMQLRIDNEIGAKTGTTQHASDGWFMGLTHDLVAGGWVGGDEPSIRFRNWGLGSGSRTAMPIWEKFMLSIYNDERLPYKKGPFPTPPASFNIELDCGKYRNEDEESDDYQDVISAEDPGIAF